MLSFNNLSHQKYPRLIKVTSKLSESNIFKYFGISRETYTTKTTKPGIRNKNTNENCRASVSDSKASRYIKLAGPIKSKSRSPESSQVKQKGKLIDIPFGSLIQNKSSSRSTTKKHKARRKQDKILDSSFFAKTLGSGSDLRDNSEEQDENIFLENYFSEAFHGFPENNRPTSRKKKWKESNECKEMDSSRSSRHNSDNRKRNRKHKSILERLGDDFSYGFDNDLQKPWKEVSTIPTNASLSDGFKETISSVYSTAYTTSRLSKAKRPQEVHIPIEISVKELAARMCMKVDQLLKVLKELGENSVSHSTILTQEIAELVVVESYLKPVLLSPEFVDISPTIPPVDVSHLPRRPPVVTVMGHVDHGKTTLLDKLRHSDQASNERGGITQRIGAFIIKHDTVKSEYSGLNDITFIDTPGHAAFQDMRARGSEVTDIIVLVIAADDGLRPQTEEVISLARENSIPVIVAISKCDKFSESEYSTVKTRISDELLKQGLVTELHGGDVQVACISSLSGYGLDDLIGAIQLQSEIMELHADFEAPGEGMIIESTMGRGVGALADVLVKWGTISIGHFIVAGTEYGKVKVIELPSGERVKKAGPSTPVRIQGFKGSVPPIGEYVLVVSSENHAKEIVEGRRKQIEWDRLRSEETEDSGCSKKNIRKISMSPRQIRIMKEEEALKDQEEERRIAALKPGEAGYIPRVLPIILKTDTLGSISALENMVASLPADEVSLKTIHASIGSISSSDIDLASSFNATIFGFNVRHSARIDREAKHKKVDIRQHDVIFGLLDDLRGLLSSHLSPIEEDEVFGIAEVQQAFPISSKGLKDLYIAGCRITSGVLKMDGAYRVKRSGKIVAEVQRPLSMRHYKEKVSIMNKGQECGIQLPDYNDYQVGDVLECFTRRSVPRVL